MSITLELDGHESHMSVIILAALKYIWKISVVDGTDLITEVIIDGFYLVFWKTE